MKIFHLSSSGAFPRCQRPEGIVMVIYFHDAQLVNACELRLDAGRLAGQRANRTAGTGVCVTGKI